MPPYPTTIPLVSPPYLFQQPNYQDYFPDPGAFFLSPAEHPQPEQPTMKSAEEEVEDEDTSSRPRLSPEQLAILEEHFQSHPKPNTDFKRQLAERLGLSLSRVNVSLLRAPFLLFPNCCRTGIRIVVLSSDIRGPRLDDSMFSPMTPMDYGRNQCRPLSVSRTFQARQFQSQDKSQSCLVRNPPEQMTTSYGQSSMI